VNGELTHAIHGSPTILKGYDQGVDLLGASFELAHLVSPFAPDRSGYISVRPVRIA
jgi:hypothetical protein